MPIIQVLLSLGPSDELGDKDIKDNHYVQFIAKVPTKLMKFLEFQDKNDISF